MMAYKIFLSHNIVDSTPLILEIVHKVAEKNQVMIKVLSPGVAAANPAEEARRLLEMESIEALLAVFHRESSWVSNEIGMAYTWGLPVYVIANLGVDVGGISKLVTSILHADVFNPDSLRLALNSAFQILAKKIEEDRGRLPEPPMPGEAIEVIRWSRFYELVRRGAREIMKDPDPIQKGFRPTLVLGISRGGIIVADLVSRLAGDLPLGLLAADRKVRGSTIIYPMEPTKTLLRRHLKEVSRKQQARILIVDDVMKSGRSLQAALNQVRGLLTSLGAGDEQTAVVKSLVLIVRGNASATQPDYRFLDVPHDVGIVLPYGLG